MTRTTTAARKSKDARRGRPLGGGGGRGTGADALLLAEAAKLAAVPGKRGPGALLLAEIGQLAADGTRALPHKLAVAAEAAGFNGNAVLSLALERRAKKIEEAEFRAGLNKALSSFRKIEDEAERRELAALGYGDGWEAAAPAVSDVELRAFHVRADAEADRKRVCPALPVDELRSVLNALRSRRWKDKRQWLRMEALRRWLAMSPEAIGRAARSGRWATDIRLEGPDSRQKGGGAKRCGKPRILLGPRAVARVLRAYAAGGGELGAAAVKTARALDVAGRRMAAAA